MSNPKKDHSIVVWWKQCFLACGEHREVWMIGTHRPFRASL